MKAIFDTLTPAMQQQATKMAEDALSVIAKRKALSSNGKEAIAPKVTKAHTSLAPKAKGKKVEVSKVEEKKVEVAKAAFVKVEKLTGRLSMKMINANFAANKIDAFVEGANYVITITKNGKKQTLPQKHWSDITLEEWMNLGK